MPPPPALAEEKTTTDITDDETSIVKDAQFAAELEFGEERTVFEDATDGANVNGEGNTTITNSPDQEISNLKNEIEGYKAEYSNTTDQEVKRELRRLITETRKTLNLLLRQSARDGKPFHCSTDVLEMRCC